MHEPSGVPFEPQPLTAIDPHDRGSSNPRFPRGFLGKRVLDQRREEETQSSGRRGEAPSTVARRATRRFDRSFWVRVIEAIEDRSAHDAVGVLARVLVGIAGFNEERSTRWFVAWGTSEDAVRLAVRHELVVRREGITSGKPFGKVARAVVRFVERGTTVNLDELEALRVLAGGGRLTYEQVGLVSGLEAKHAAIRVERSRAGARGNLISRGFVVGRTTEDRSSVRKVNAA
jgi:hypothetical protein